MKNTKVVYLLLLIIFSSCVDKKNSGAQTSSGIQITESTSIAEFYKYSHFKLDIESVKWERKFTDNNFGSSHSTMMAVVNLKDNIDTSLALEENFILKRNMNEWVEAKIKKCLEPTGNLGEYKVNCKALKVSQLLDEEFEFWAGDCIVLNPKEIVLFLYPRYAN